MSRPGYRYPAAVLVQFSEGARLVDLTSIKALFADGVAGIALVLTERGLEAWWKTPDGKHYRALMRGAYTST